MKTFKIALAALAALMITGCSSQASKMAEGMVDAGKRSTSYARVENDSGKKRVEFCLVEDWAENEHNLRQLAAVKLLNRWKEESAGDIARIIAMDPSYQGMTPLEADVALDSQLWDYSQGKVARYLVVTREMRAAWCELEVARFTRFAGMALETAYALQDGSDWALGVRAFEKQFLNPVVKMSGVALVLHRIFEPEDYVSDTKIQNNNNNDGVQATGGDAKGGNATGGNSNANGGEITFEEGAVTAKGGDGGSGGSGGAGGVGTATATTGPVDANASSVSNIGDQEQQLEVVVE